MLFKDVVEYSAATTGLVTLSLPANSTLIPANSYYRIEIGTDRPKRLYIVVPGGAGPYDVEDVLHEPGEVDESALAAHRATVRTHDDVSDTAPTAGQGLIWSGTEWVPGDTVSTDIEAASAIAAHNALATGVHGVGASTVESVAGSTAKVTTETSARQAADAAESAARIAADGAESAARAAADTAEANARAAADALLIPLVQKAAANGVATLGPDGLVPTAQIPAIALGDETFTVASQAAMLATAAHRGDLAKRTDLAPVRTFILTGDDPTVLAAWLEVASDSTIVSVNGQAGVVVLGPADVGADPAGTAAAGDATRQPLDADLTAFAALDSSTPGFVATDGGGWIKKTAATFKTALSLVKGDVGLGNVDNTADTAKPVSNAQQAALDAKVAKALYDANSLLVADVDDTPSALTVAASRVIGRKATGGISAMTVAELKALLALVAAEIGVSPAVLSATDVQAALVALKNASQGEIAYAERLTNVACGAGYTLLGVSMSVTTDGRPIWLQIGGSIQKITNAGAVTVGLDVGGVTDYIAHYISPLAVNQQLGFYRRVRWNLAAGTYVMRMYATPSNVGANVYGSAAYEPLWCCASYAGAAA